MTKVWNGFVGSVTKFASEHPAVVKSIIAIAGELGAFLIVYNGYKAAKAAMNTLSTISNALKKADAAASAAQAAATVAQTGATVSATGAQLGLNAAMAANPIGLILIYNKRKRIKESCEDQIMEVQKLNLQKQRWTN